MAILITNKFPKYINLTASSVNSMFLTWGQSIPARFWGTETPEYWGGIDEQAQEHYDRVIADGGVLPSGLGGVNSFFQVVKEIYSTADINTAISVGLDPQVLGYKLGAGSGTTLGQAAQKLYSVKSTENLLTFSEQFQNAAWDKIDATVTANATTSPTGTLTADKLIASATNSVHLALQTPAGQIAGINTVFSVFAKASEFTKFVLTNNAGGGGYATFDLSLGTFILSSGVSASIENVGNGWYRCSLVYTPNTTGTFNAQIRLLNLSGNGTFLGDGTSGVFVWGAQLNTGSVALPYTPTTTTKETLADVVQTTAASQPLLLVHEGANYWFGSGVSGNFVSTPSASANQITSDIEIIAKIDYSNSGSFQFIQSTYATSGYSIGISSSDRIYAEFKVGATNYGINSTVSIGATFSGFIKVTRTTADGIAKFFTSLDGITYTQLGANVGTAVGALVVSGTNLLIGAYLGGSPFRGKIYRATIANSIGGTPVVDFNPNQYNAATSQTQWTSSTGEIWSIQTGTATTGYKGVLVDRTIMQGDGVDDLLINAIVRPNILTQYLATNTYTNDNSGNAVLVDSNSGSYLNSIVAFTSIVGNIMNGFASDLTKAKSANVVYLVTTSNNSGVKNAISVNNGTETTNAYTPALSGNGISILSRSSGGTKANALIRTYLLSNAQDDSTVRTDMYNYIRSINNSAF
jgi:hypothetical protein